MLYAIVAVTILILDQALKYWTVLHFAAPPASAVVTSSASEALIPGVLDLTRVHNYGAAWGILENARWLFIVITVVFIVAVILLLKMKIVKGDFGRWTLIFVLAGAVGNGIDRVIQGYVVDMFALQGILDWFPVFNIADIFITVGGILFCLYIIFHKDPLSGQKQPAEAGETAPARRASRTEYSEPSGDRKAAHAAPRRPERPARREPVDLPPVKPADPEDPFAEWLGPQGGAPRKAAPKPEEPVVRVIESAPMPELRQRPAAEPGAAAESGAKPAAEAKKPAVPPYKPVEEEFSLEDILNEFRDV